MAYERPDKIHLDTGRDFSPTRVEPVQAHDEDLEKVGLDQVMSKLESPAPPAFDLEGQVSRDEALKLGALVGVIGDAIDARERGDTAFAERVEAELEKHAVVGKVMRGIAETGDIARRYFQHKGSLPQRALRGVATGAQKLEKSLEPKKPGVVSRLLGQSEEAKQIAALRHAQRLEAEQGKLEVLKKMREQAIESMSSAPVTVAEDVAQRAARKFNPGSAALPLGVAGGAGGAVAVQRYSKRD